METRLSSAPLPPSQHTKPMSWTFEIYAAGKVWHNEKFRELRDVHGYPINSRWIDLDNQGELVLNRKDLLWDICLDDVKNADFVVLYCEKLEEDHKGTVMECGHAMALGKPIYCIGKARTFIASDTSDVAFTHHKLWNWTRATTLYSGFNEAVNKYKRDYLMLPHLNYHTI